MQDVVEEERIAEANQAHLLEQYILRRKLFAPEFVEEFEAANSHLIPAYLPTDENMILSEGTSGKSERGFVKCTPTARVIVYRKSSQSPS